ncbi:MAG: rod shape-determining protein MreC [Treponema sp.]|nr:rod shape-determining protein MreC [Treponema sp.]
MAEKKHSSFSFRLAEFILIGLLLLSGLSLTFSSGRFILDFKRIGFTAVSTIEKGVHYVVDGCISTVNAVKELHHLKKEYHILLEKLDNYEKMQRSNTEIRKENERLREQLGFVTYMEEKNIPAQIIARDMDSAYSYLTIDKGSVDGIKKNMPVVAFQNGNQGLIGKIVQVGAFTSQIIPIYNIDNIISARIQNTRDLGLVSGKGSETIPLSMQYIQKRVFDQLSIGDIVVTSGENGNYMRDIPIGSISKITILDYNSSLNIELNPIIDFSRLETVIVVNQKELNDRQMSD